MHELLRLSKDQPSLRFRPGFQPNTKTVDREGGLLAADFLSAIDMSSTTLTSIAHFFSAAGFHHDKGRSLPRLTLF